MQVFIPFGTRGLEAFLQDFQNTTMAEIQSKICQIGRCEELQFGLPKFKIESTLKLEEPLQKVR